MRLAPVSAVARMAPQAVSLRRRKLARAVAAGGACIASLLVPATASAVAPAPCGGLPQLTDVTGDGHHNTTDITAAWLSESAGRLQAVVKVTAGNWAPDHDDSEAAGFALLFDAGGQTRYVRATAPQPAAGPVRFDYGTWSLAGGFASQGPTSGSIVGGAGGTATIDVPAATGATSGVVLRRVVALTYDGFENPTTPHWVDRGPGGTTPAGTEFGSDYVVGSCGAGGLINGPPGAVGTVAAVSLRAPSKQTGARRVTVAGTVRPARRGVPVQLTVRAAKRTTRRLLTRSDGSFSTRLSIGETTSVRATAGGLGSQTRTITVTSRTRIKVRRLRSGGVLVSGRVSPALPGRVALLRTDEVRPSARTTTRKGRFSMRFKRLPRGRYQAVFVPSKGRAKRSVSNKGAVR